MIQNKKVILDDDRLERINNNNHARNDLINCWIKGFSFHNCKIEFWIQVAISP